MYGARTDGRARVHRYSEGASEKSHKGTRLAHPSRVIVHSLVSVESWARVRPRAAKALLKTGKRYP